MKIKTLFALFLPLLVMLFVGCSNRQNMQNSSSTINLPVVSFEGSGDHVNPAFYENGFDFKYDNLPVLTLSESSGILQIALADNFEDFVYIEEDYYLYVNNEGICEKNTYKLLKDDKNTVCLPISRRGIVRDEEAVYFLENDQGTFVFKIILPLSKKD